MTEKEQFLMEKTSQILDRDTSTMNLVDIIQELVFCIDATNKTFKYEVYMMYGGETGQPERSREFHAEINAVSFEDAFNQWVKLNNFEQRNFRQIAENKWNDYYTVYVNEITSN